MKFNQLKINSKKNSRRPGRGISAGRGKTAGRGTKGQNSRTGGGTRPGFEGGQNPLYARLPKLPGFKSRIRPYQEVSTTLLEKHFNDKDAVDNESLHQLNLIKDKFSRVKIIMGGDITKSLKVNVQAISITARQAIESKGGSVTIDDKPKRETKAKQSS